MATNLKRLCVFCGSSMGGHPSYSQAARELGRELARRSIELVYGGGNVGLMGEVADAVMAEGGSVTGVIPEFLVRKEVAHRDLTRLEVVDSMHTRKLRMSELADGFIALPGGFGTFEELFEIVTWAQLGLHKKPCGVLNIEGFYDHLHSFIEKTIAEGFVRANQRDVILWSATPANLLDAFARWEPSKVEKWMTDPSKT